VEAAFDFIIFIISVICVDSAVMSLLGLLVADSAASAMRAILVTSSTLVGDDKRTCTFIVSFRPLIMAKRTSSWSVIGIMRAMLIMSVMYASTDSVGPCSRVHIEVAFCHVVISVSENRWRNSLVRSVKLSVMVDGNERSHSSAGPVSSSLKSFNFAVLSIPLNEV